MTREQQVDPYEKLVYKASGALRPNLRIVNAY